MKAPFSSKAAIAAAALVVLHLIATVYVQATGMAYDQGDMVGLLWWLVAFWVLPVIALIVLAMSLAVHFLSLNNDGQ
ncbi:MAG TPA: hypothetical protein VE053_06450 [Allosphingosinicella sp.]|nr:hypothetical protein [Allosphingosinicella sp.]